MKLVLWLILIAIVLIFAPYLFLDLILLGAATVKWVFTDPLWKYFFYVVGSIIVLGLFWELVRPRTPEEKKKGDYHREQLEKIKDPRKKAEYIENMRQDIKKELGLEER